MRRLRTVAAGLAMVPFGAALATSAKLAPLLASSIGALRVITTGSLLAAAGFAWQGLLNAHSRYLPGMLGPGLLFSAGTGPPSAASTYVPRRSVPARATHPWPAAPATSLDAVRRSGRRAPHRRRSVPPSTASGSSSTRSGRTTASPYATWTCWTRAPDRVPPPVVQARFVGKDPTNLA